MKWVAFLLLLVGSTSLAIADTPSDEDPALLRELNKARAEYRDTFHPKGLQAFIRVAPLDWLAQQTMMFQTQNYDITHDYVPPEGKEQYFDWYLEMLAKRTIPTRYWKCFELLALFHTLSPSLHEVAHVFDDSPEHRRAFYDPQALWVGYSIRSSFTDRNEKSVGTYYVLYVCVLQDELSLDKVRKLHIPGDRTAEDAWGWGPLVPNANGGLQPAPQGQ